MKIRLDDKEVSLCKYIGTLRSSIARSNGVVDAKIGNQDGGEADIQGFKAEYAFAKANGMSEDDLIVLASSNPNLNLELISSGTAAGNPGGSGLTSGTGTPLTGSTGSGGGGGGTTVSGN